MAEHIQIGDISPTIQYVADGVQTAFTYPFPIFVDADIGVYQDASLKTLLTDYTVSGAGQSAGGSVTFVSPPVNGAIITLKRDLTIERSTDFQEAGEFRASVINDELDKIVAMAQQLDETLSRRVGRPSTSTESYALDWPDGADATTRYLQVDSTNGITISDDAALLASLPANGLSMLRVNAGETAYEFRTPAEVVSDLGIEAGADVTDTASVTAAGALMDSELANIAAVKALDQGVATTNAVAFKAVDATVGVGGNDVAVVVTQNDTTNNPNAQNIVNAGNGNGLFIDQNGNGVSLNIDSLATTAHGMVLSADSLTTGYGFRLINTNGIYTNGNGFLSVVLDNAASTGVLAKFHNDGSGQGILLNQNGAGTGLQINQNSVARAVHLEHSQTGVDVEWLANTHASFASSMEVKAVNRAATTAYSFARWYSSGVGDKEFEFRGDGNAYCDGGWTGGGADYAEYFEWSDANPTNEDRRGWSVVLDGAKIRRALAGEAPIGVISSNPSVVGDGDIGRWKEKYLKDDFGTYIEEDYEAWEWEEAVEIEPAVAAVTEQREEPIVVVENVTEDYEEIIDGVLYQRQRTVQKEVPQMEDVLLVDELGKPVKDKQGKQRVWKKPLMTTVTVEIEPAKEAKIEKKLHSYASDEVPAGVTVPATKAVTVQQRRKLNPLYDPNAEYIPREDRPEWDTVGLVGKLRILKGEAVAPGWIKMRDVSGAVEEWLVR